MSLLSWSTATKVWWLCHNGHEWEAKVNNRNNGSGCPFCSNNRVLVGFNDLATTHPYILDDWDYDLNVITPQEITHGSNTQIWWKCITGKHSWKCSVKQKIKMRQCDVCEKSFSNMEKIVFEYLKKNYDGVILKHQRIINSDSGRLEIDLLLPDLNIGFEVQDFATHSKDREDELTSYKNLNILKKGPSYHKNKIDLAREQLGVEVIEIWEDEIINYSFKNKIDDYVLN